MNRAGHSAWLALIGATTALLWLSPLEAKEPALPGATVDSVVTLARRLSPELAAAALDAEAAVHKIGTAGVLADPTFEFEAWDVNGRGVGQRRFAVSQEFKLWGKRDLELDVARADASAARHQSTAATVDLVARVKAVHAEYNSAHEALALSLDLKNRIDQISALLRSRYGTTSVEQQDVIKADIESATAEVDIARRRGDLKAAAARLNTLIGRRPLEALAAPTGFRPIKANLTIAGIQARAHAANPALAASAALVGSAKGTKSLTDLNGYPDVTLGARYVQRPVGSDTGEFLVGIKLPLQVDAKDAAQRAASSNLGASQARLDALRLKLDGAITDAWIGFDTVEQAIRIHTARLLPPSELSVKAARSGFEAGTTDLSIVFEAERRLRSIHLDLIKLRVEQQSRYAEMERLAGGSL